MPHLGIAAVEEVELQEVPGEPRRHGGELVRLLDLFFYVLFIAVFAV